MAKARMSKREKEVEEFFEWPMIGLTVILLFILVLPLLFTLSPALLRALAVFDVIIWILFYLEMFVKFFVSSNWAATAKRNWFLLLILISPLLLSFRLVRLARLVSLLRVFNLQRIVARLKKSVQTVVYNIEYIVLLLLVFSLVSSFVIWQVETQLGGAITSYADALWWSVVTITTIGYGDVIPGTPAGKVVGSVVSFVGIILFTVMVARITAIFVRYDNKW